MKLQPDQEFETVQEAAARLGVTIRAVQKQAAAGRIPGAVKHSRAWFIPQGAVPVTEAELRHAQAALNGVPDVRRMALPLLNSAYAPGEAMGRKDIIKIDENISIDLDVLGYIDPGITVNVIEGGEIVEKKHLNLPTKLVNVVYCKNPRCITSVEGALDHIFALKDEKRRVYRCVYCDAERSKQ